MGRSIRRDKLHKTDPRGNLYYVRLNTEYGPLYKIGFTTHESVEARMSYDGSADWKYIDQTLMFKNLPDAFKVEQKLHAYLDNKKAFEKYSANVEFPLYRNGQTELYIEDVLGLDPDYSESQKIQTTRRLKDKRLMLAGKSHRQDSLESLILKFFLILTAPLGIILIAVISILEGANTKKELFDYFDRLTGSKRDTKRKDADLKILIQNILHEIKA